MEHGCAGTWPLLHLDGGLLHVLDGGLLNNLRRQGETYPCHRTAHQMPSVSPEPLREEMARHQNAFGDMPGRLHGPAKRCAEQAALCEPIGPPSW
jgi:hypothetical protein